MTGKATFMTSINFPLKYHGGFEIIFKDEGKGITKGHLIDGPMKGKETPKYGQFLNWFSNAAVQAKIIKWDKIVLGFGGIFTSQGCKSAGYYFEPKFGEIDFTRRSFNEDFAKEYQDVTNFSTEELTTKYGSGTVYDLKVSGQSGQQYDQQGNQQFQNNQFQGNQNNQQPMGLQGNQQFGHMGQQFQQAPFMQQNQQNKQGFQQNQQFQQPLNAPFQQQNQQFQQPLNAPFQQPLNQQNPSLNSNQLNAPFQQPNQQNPSLNSNQLNVPFQQPQNQQFQQPQNQQNPPLNQSFGSQQSFGTIGNQQINTTDIGALNNTLKNIGKQ